MYGLLLKQIDNLVCVYNECHECSNLRCPKKAEYVLRRFRLRHEGLSGGHSVLFRFSDVEDCLRGLQAMFISGIKAKIIYHIL